MLFYELWVNFLLQLKILVYFATILMLLGVVGSNLDQVGSKEFCFNENPDSPNQSLWYI